MKHLFFLIAIVATVLWVACDREEMPTPPTSEQTDVSAAKFVDFGAQDQAKVDALVAQKQAKGREIKEMLAKKSFGPATAGIIYKVPDDFPTIQAAVDAASPGDKIKVDSGVYNEVVWISTPSLTVTGSAEVHGAFEVWWADGVRIEGFTVYENGPNQAGIDVNFSNNVYLKDNHVIGACEYWWQSGIWFWYADNGLIKDNKLEGNGLGIWIEPGNGNYVKGNEVFDSCHQGIRQTGGSGNEYAYNDVHDNANGGIVLRFCSNNKVRNNTCNNSAIGVAVYWDSHHNEIFSDNVARYNSSYGIGIVESDYNKVYKFTALDNGVYDCFNQDGNVGNEYKKNTFGTCYRCGCD